MRELTKALMSYSLATSVLGLQQLTELLGGGGTANTTDVFSDLTARTVGHLNRPMRTTFKAGDALQRTAVDILLGGWIPSMDSLRGAMGALGGAPGAVDAPLPAPEPGSWAWEDSRAPRAVADERVHSTLAF